LQQGVELARRLQRRLEPTQGGDHPLHDPALLAAVLHELQVLAAL
jgi:hypothetical protein